MSEPIKVRDLVRVSKPCCYHMLRYPIFRVAGFERFEDYMCKACHTDSPSSLFAVSEENRRWHVPVPWLKRIPPLEEVEGIETQEPLKAIA